MKKIRVILADDNREFVQMLTEYVEDQEDMEVMGVAYNGDEVMELIESGKVPDVLILDIIMPHLDGLGVLEKLREMELTPQPKIIMLTAFGQENITQKAVQLGASYYILKPFDLDVLSNRVRQLLANSSEPSSSAVKKTWCPWPKGKTWTPTSPTLFMKSGCRPILKGTNISVKPSRWFTTTLKFSGRSRRRSTRP